MTPTELKSIRQSLGLSAEAFAALLRVQSGRTVRRWEAGERDVPGPVIVIAEGLRDSAALRRYFRVALKPDSTGAMES
jgi:transcriptional regulator with XRE-family HTH domain